MDDKSNGPHLMLKNEITAPKCYLIVVKELYGNIAMVLKYVLTSHY